MGSPLSNSCPNVRNKDNVERKVKSELTEKDVINFISVLLCVNPCV